MMKGSQTTHPQWSMSGERFALRMNLASGLLGDVAYNVARKNNNIVFYEIERIFYQTEDPAKNLPTEENHLALTLAGNTVVKDWQTKATAIDFYIVKGLVENIVAVLGLIEKVSYRVATTIPEMHSGRIAWIYLEDEAVDLVGQVYPTTVKAYDIPKAYVAESNPQRLVVMEAGRVTYETISKFPAVSRDVALLVDETVTNQELVKTISDSAGKCLKEIRLFDVYQGERLGVDKKSMAYSLTFVSTEATLVDERINRSMEKVEKALIEKRQVEVR